MRQLRYIALKLLLLVAAHGGISSVCSIEPTCLELLRAAAIDGRRVNQNEYGWNLVDHRDRYVLNDRVLEKILYGVADPNHPGQFMGGHSPRVLKTSHFHVSVFLAPEKNGVIRVNARMLLAGDLRSPEFSKYRYVTLAPTGWSDSDIVAAICAAAKDRYLIRLTPPARSLHAARVNGVVWAVIKSTNVGGVVVTAFPVADEELHLHQLDLRPLAEVTIPLTGTRK